MIQNSNPLKLIHQKLRNTYTSAYAKGPTKSLPKSVKAKPSPSNDDVSESLKTPEKHLLLKPSSQDGLFLLSDDEVNINSDSDKNNNSERNSFASGSKITNTCIVQITDQKKQAVQNLHRSAMMILVFPRSQKTPTELIEGHSMQDGIKLCLLLNIISTLLLY